MVFLVSVLIILSIFIAFVVVGIMINKRNLRKDKYDLLHYLKKNIGTVSITINEDGQNTLQLNANDKFPLASTVKIIIAFNFVRLVKKLGVR